jgi:ubiquitin C
MGIFSFGKKKAPSEEQAKENPNKNEKAPEKTEKKEEVNKEKETENKKETTETVKKQYDSFDQKQVLNYFATKEIKLDLQKTSYTIDEFKQLIADQLYIPKHRVKLLFDDEEKDNNQIINDIVCEKFELGINSEPQENDKVDIEVVDCRRQVEQKENFEVKVDLYGDLLEQICDLKNIINSGLYLMYQDTFSDYKYKMFADHHSGQKIKVELYDVEKDGNMELYIKTLTGNTITLNVDQYEHVGYLKTRIFEKEQIPVGQQKLVFAGKLLEDNKTLENYNIEKECTIQLFLKLKKAK